MKRNRETFSVHQSREIEVCIIHPNANANKIFCLTIPMFSRSSRPKFCTIGKWFFFEDEVDRARRYSAINHYWQEAESVYLAAVYLPTLTKLLKSTEARFLYCLQCTEKCIKTRSWQRLPTAHWTKGEKLAQTENPTRVVRKKSPLLFGNAMPCQSVVIQYK